MIDRAPDLEQARAAATAMLADDKLNLEPEPAPAPAQEASSSAAAPPDAPPPRKHDREKMVAACTVLIGVGSIKLAQKWGAHWQYSPEEAGEIAEAAVDVAEMYSSAVTSPWSRLGMALGATILPRMLGPKLPPLVIVEPAAPGAPEHLEEVKAN